ncbi:hypothetical protein [Dyadobacter luticola]|uniref:Uncharacterized protein n=1 Tax=Dyadobacter luticola TaxID=1979387 RepID=A0A5R9KTN4_9BACT|nr:hypothetical protein [Dyadobacter luticola]TLU99570.1 hypothetical protein FEN17_23745 [Dyadobacter luticola]
MSPFFETTTGKLIRYITFIPIHIFAMVIIFMINAYLFNLAGNWFGGLIIPGITGASFGSVISSEVYPGKNKKRLIAFYLGFFIVMNLISFYLFMKSDEPISKQFETVTATIGIFGGYLLAYKFVGSVN